MIGIKSGVIKTFDVTKQDFIKQQTCFKPEDGLMIGLERQDGYYAVFVLYNYHNISYLYLIAYIFVQMVIVTVSIRQ